MLEFQADQPRRKGSREEQVLRFVLNCSPHSVSQTAYGFLQEQGYCPQNHQQAYTLLVAGYEQFRSDKARDQILGELEPLLTGEHENFRERRNRVYKLMRELQVRKRLQNLRTSAGVMLTKATTIACEMARHWDGISMAQGKSVPECTAYI